MIISQELTSSAEPIVGNEPVLIDPEIEEMLKAGVHFGHAKSKNHPSMQPYIYGVRNTISVIDLVKTKEKLAEAATFLRSVAARGGIFLLVGTRPGARKVIAEMAARLGVPYFTERWIGGTLTNFKVISKRVERLVTLEREKATGGFEKFTKKERMHKEEEIIRLKRFFDGLRTLTRLPDAVVIVDVTHDTTAVHESQRIRIPIVALADTNSNITGITYPIPSSDDSLSAVTYMMRKLETAIEEGRRQHIDRQMPKAE